MDWSKKSHRGLRTWILFIIQNEPKNGAEIMDSMESTSRGWWRPSPGSVYPMLQQLTGEGLVKKRETDGKYEITPQGKEEIEWPSRISRGGPRSVEGTIDELSSYVAYLEDLSQVKDRRIAENAGKIRELGERLAKVTQGK
ncbi:MAG TPA: PadR family transcriptional regulator [Nitrososphaerales archaeon]|nr:PadR family transcriptional regulator [Nitrososphaerales archaeon]